MLGAFSTSSCGPKKRPSAGRGQRSGRKLEVTSATLICSAGPSPGSAPFVTQMPGDLIELRGALPKMENLKRGEGSAAGVAETRPEDSETIGRGIWQRAQKYSIHEAEDGGIRADPDRQRQNHKQREQPALSRSRATHTENPAALIRISGTATIRSFAPARRPCCQTHAAPQSEPRQAPFPVADSFQ